jgi:hypothetical protein
MRSYDDWETFICKIVEFYMGHEIDIPDMEETYILRGGGILEWRYFGQHLTLN